jgi:hypothetical protein
MLRGMAMADFKETEFEKHIREYTELALDMLGTGKITSEEQLKKYVFKACEFLSSCDAYCFITSQAPFDWDDIFSLDLLQEYEYNLPSFVLYSATIAVSLEVFNRLLETDAYRFLMEGGQTAMATLQPNTTPIVFQEYWKDDAKQYTDSQVIETISDEDVEFAIYELSDDQRVYVMSHIDASLVWIGKTAEN